MVKFFKYFAGFLILEKESLKKVEEKLYESVRGGEELVLLDEQWSDYGYELFMTGRQSLGYEVILSSAKHRKHIVDASLELNEKSKFTALTGLIQNIFGYLLDNEGKALEFLKGFQPSYQKKLLQIIKKKGKEEIHFIKNQTMMQFLELLEENWKVLLYLFEKLKTEEIKKLISDPNRIAAVFMSTFLVCAAEYCKESRQDIKIIYRKVDSLLLLMLENVALKDFYPKIKFAVEMDEKDRV